MTLATDFVREAQRRVKQQNLYAYLTEQQRRYDLYMGEYRRYVVATLRERNPNTWAEFSPVYIDLLRMVVDRRAGGMYRPAPERTFTAQGAAVSEDIAQRAETLYADAQLDVVLDKAARYCQLHRTIVARPVWRHGRVEVDILPPMQWSLIQSAQNPTVLDDAAAWIEHHAGRSDTLGVADEIRDTLWTWHSASPGNRKGTPQWFTVNADGAIIAQGDNPYWYQIGRAKRWIAPVAVLRYEDPDQAFFLPGGDDLTDAAIHVAYELTDLARTVAFQSHGQPVFTGLSGPEAARMLLSPSRGIGLAEGQKFEYVSTNAGALVHRIEVLRGFLSQLAHSYDLPADTFDDNRKPESGVARRIANSPLHRMRNAYAQRLAGFESDLFARMAVIHNRQSAPNNALPEGLSVRVTPALQNTPLDPVEQLEVDSRRLAQGVISPVDLIMRDRGCDEETAARVYQENVTRNTQVGAAGLRNALAARIAARQE